ncbi:MAG: glycoside hydrolase family 15 protein [Acidobacteria bacterium]|nr:MAG: glycoside hydrolase family 15 protein [Acidobacteriota bacterium]
MRVDGYAPIEDYALIGDGRTAALVARDGAIDWLCLPNMDSPSVFAAILDASRGGAFVVQPSIPFDSSRRYVPNTNVLETTFTTARGSVRVIDALTLPDGRLEPMREIVRSLEGLSGAVPMRWHFAPRFDYAAASPRWDTRNGRPVATSGASGARALLALSTAYAEPLVFPTRQALEARLAYTISFWQSWVAGRGYDGPWRDPVTRSALVLKALIFAPSGASVAAPTTSLPEEIGGERNWDYRFCWIRDSSFLIDALLELNCYDETRSLFWWFMQATAITEPELHVLYRLDGGIGTTEHDLPLAGYRGSRPVRVGNGALEQRQLAIYDTGRVLARIADYVCTIWQGPDSGIWEVRNGPFHFTHSKVMCWLALDRAGRLADRGELPARHRDRWRREADAIRAFVEGRCWSDALGSYSRIAGSSDVDASLLMLPIVGYGDPRGGRIAGTIDAVTRSLRHGDFVYRYRADDGVPGGEGCFLNCSFWLVSALARAGRVDEATSLMDRLVARANDVGLYAEEVDRNSGACLGNHPQALVHLALVDAACAIRNRS